MSQSLGRLLWDRYRGDRDTVLFVEATDNGVTTTVGGEFVALASRLAIALERRGLGAGARVTVATGQSLETNALLLAVWMLGAVTVHIDAALEPASLSEALTRAKATWIIVDDVRALAQVESLSEEAAKHSTFLVLGEVKKESPTLVAYKTLAAEGKQYRTIGLDKLAKTVFTVPAEARACIFYEASAEGMSASAASHGELMELFAARPKATPVTTEERILVALAPSTRERVALPFQLVAQGLQVAFVSPDIQDHAPLKALAPEVTLSDGAQLAEWIELIDRRDEKMSVHSALKSGLGWLEKRMEKEDEHRAVRKVLSRVDDWTERGLAMALKTEFGGKLRIAWTPKEAPSPDVIQLLSAAGIASVS